MHKLTFKQAITWSKLKIQVNPKQPEFTIERYSCLQNKFAQPRCLLQFSGTLNRNIIDLNMIVTEANQIEAKTERPKLQPNPIFCQI